jgi:hypothetical protein
MSQPLIVSRPPPRTARFRFVTQEQSSFGRLIRWRTMGEVSHVEMVLPDGSIISALSDQGVCHVEGDYDTTSTMQIFVDFPLHDLDLLRWVAYLRSRIGRPYDWNAIYGEALFRDWRRPGGMICSMLAALSAREAKIFPRPLSERAHEISPRDLLLMFSGHPSAIIHPKEERK